MGAPSHVHCALPWPSMPESRPLLIAAEGPDGVGKTAALDRLARWLERRGRHVSLVGREPSPLVRAAAASTRTRTQLTPRVAALLEASDDLAAAEREIGPRLSHGRVVLADRYAWTAVARQVARGLDPGWVGLLQSPLPRPDLVILFRQRPGVVVERALAARPRNAELTAVADAFEAFVVRLVAAYDALAEGAAADDARPWPVPVVTVDAKLAPDDADRAVRDAVRAWL